MTSFEKAQEFISRKYNLSIIRELILAKEGNGFNSIQRNIPGITPRILSTRLKELEKLGLIKKNLVLGEKPKIEYTVTSKGEALKKIINDFEKWSNKEI